MIEKEVFYNSLKNIPKAEIHLHSEALVDKKSASEILARKYPEYKKKNEIEKLFSFSSLKDFIRVFLFIQSGFDKISDFEKLFSSILPYLKRNGIVYAEIFFSPSNYVRNGISFESIMNVFIKKVHEIKEQEDIDIKIIIDVSRTFGLENAKKNLEYVINCRCEEIIGIGLGGDEKKGPAKQFKEVFMKAKELGFRRVAHAGEDVGPVSIWDAIKFLDAERIGHGISSIQDEVLINYLIENNIPLEVCPTSNIFTKKYVKKLENHPIKPLFDKGVLVTLNTDDPAFFNVELIDEYWNLYSKLNFSLEDIKKIIINGFHACFISDDKKKKYINKVNSAWKKYFNF